MNGEKRNPLSPIHQDNCVEGEKSGMTADDAVSPRADYSLRRLDSPIYPTFIIKSGHLLTGVDKDIISNDDTPLLRLNKRFSCFTLFSKQPRLFPTLHET